MSFIPSLDVLISTNNSTTGTLAAGATFTGTSEDVSEYATVTLIGKSDVGSAIDGLSFEFSPDGSNWDLVKTHSLSAGTGHEMAIVVTGKYFRLVYKNGAIAQSYLRLQVLFHRTKNKEISYPITGHIDKNALAPLSRSIQTGRTPGGVYKNVRVNSDKALSVSIDSPTSSFGEIAMVEPTPVVQVDFVYNINADMVNTTTTGSGTVAQANSLAVLSTTANASSTAALSTKRYLKYRPGQGGDVKFTAIFTTGVANSEQVAGTGSATNGYFFGYNAAAFGIARFNNGSATWTTQTSWNIDVMDGTGDDNNPSGVLLDTTKGNVYAISFQWLGFGAIDYCIEDPKTGKLTVVHREQYANNNTVPSVAIPSFPIHYHVKNTTNTTNIVLKTSSCAAMIQGKIVHLGPVNSKGNSKTSVGTTLTNIITIRNKTTYQTLTNQIPILLASLSAAVDGTKPATVEIIINGTLGGTPSYTDISVNTSVVDYDTAGTTVTGGKNRGTFSLAKADGFFQDLKDLEITIFPGDTLTIAARASSGTTDVIASPTWIEDM